MATLRDSLDKISVVQILAHFKFEMTEDRKFYLVYRSLERHATYYVFVNDQQIPHAFAPAKFAVLDHTALFLDLVDPQSSRTLATLIEHIGTINPANVVASLASIDTFAFLNRIACLKKVTQTDFDLATSPQFHNRVFLTRGNSLAIPVYHLRAGQGRSDRLANFIYVKDQAFEYFNESRDWLTTTCYEAENRFFIITCDPHFWLEHLSANYGPDYFMALCHPHLTENTFEAILSIMEQLAFNDVFIPVPASDNDKHFLANITTRFLNRYVENLVFNVGYQDQRYEVTIASLEGSEHIAFIENLIVDVNTRITSLYLEEDSSQQLDVELQTLIAVSTSAIDSEGKKVFSISLSARTIVSREFFFSLSKVFGIGSRLKQLGSEFQ